MWSKYDSYFMVAFFLACVFAFNIYSLFIGLLQWSSCILTYVTWINLNKVNLSLFMLTIIYGETSVFDKISVDHYIQEISKVASHDLASSVIKMKYKAA